MVLTVTPLRATSRASALEAPEERLSPHLWIAETWVGKPIRKRSWGANFRAVVGVGLRASGIDPEETIVSY